MKKNRSKAKNPFRKLDKKCFLSHDEKKKAKSLKKTAPSPIMRESFPLFMRNSSLLRMKGETRAFLNAVSGVTKLDAPANAKREKRPSATSLENPVLGKQALRETDRALPKNEKKNNPAPEIAGKNTASSTPKKRRAKQARRTSISFAAMQDVTRFLERGGKWRRKRRYLFLPCRRRLTRFRIHRRKARVCACLHR